MNTAFVLYLVSRVFVTLAATMLSVAVGWHIYEATGNPFDLALVGLMQILPIAGLFLVSGWVVDSFSYPVFFLYTSALGIPALLIISYLIRHPRVSPQGDEKA